MTMKIWSCKIGEVDARYLPNGADGPMRDAVAKAYRKLTFRDPQFLFSGWGAELTEGERAVVENRAPDPSKMEGSLVTNALYARKAFAFDALIAAGLVTQQNADESLAIADQAMLRQRGEVES